ncbi:MAG: phosphatidylserine decarboxylase [Rickettsiales bacterium]|jgi:phosphatidylserine decarboxylase|nr:phosphatidylserine decarboxylase [Rickettsiales bacterium]
MDILKNFIPPIHKEGFIFIIIFLIVTIVLSYFSNFLGIIGLVASIWCFFFFRDPARIAPIGDNLIISPADGVVQKIEEVDPPSNLEMKKGKMTRVSIFLNVFNVHVNRVPATGTIKKLYYHPGKFFNASLDKASEFNERQEVLMTMSNGKEVAFSQIAGLIARRIVCDLKENEEVKAGERFGIIRFGSRMDVYLPKGINPLVSVGQTMIAGESIIADLEDKEGRLGELR